MGRAARRRTLTCIVGLGALVARRRVVGWAAVEVAIADLLASKGPGVVAADLAALDAGRRAPTSAAPAPVATA